MRGKNNKKRTAAFFDLDLTLTDQDSFRYFLRVNYLQKSPNLIFIPYVAFYGFMRKFRLISLQTFKEKSLMFLRGKSKISIRTLGNQFFEAHLLKTIRKEARRRLNWHKKRKHLIFIVSSCPDIYVSLLSEYLQCDGYECSRLAYRYNRFVGRFDGGDCLGTAKVERIRRIVRNRDLALMDSYAYSDNDSDLPLLELVGNPVAVTPTKSLRRVAVDRGWEIAEW